MRENKFHQEKVSSLLKNTAGFFLSFFTCITLIRHQSFPIRALLNKWRPIFLYSLIFIYGCGQRSYEETLQEQILRSKAVGYEQSGISIIEIDSCEYIKMEKYTSIAICHKGNCKYCEIKSNKNAKNNH